jgi:hypothetical protein
MQACILYSLDLNRSKASAAAPPPPELLAQLVNCNFHSALDLSVCMMSSQPCNSGLYM